MLSTQMIATGQMSPDHPAHIPGITPTEVADELRSRGYAREAHIPIHHVPEPHLPLLSRSRAIAIAVDVSLEQYEVVHTTSHPYRCPSPIDPGCKLQPSIWNAVVQYGMQLANYYLRGGTLPAWAGSYRTAGLDDLEDMYFGDAGYGLGGFFDWIQENPEVLTLLGAAFEAAGAALTARRVAELLKQNVPKDYLTKADLPALLAALQAQGGAGQADALSRGANQATMPAWAVPALVIGGGALIVMLMMRK